MELSPLEKRILDGWQKGFPITPRPYAAMAEALGVDEATVLATLKDLAARGVLSRVGAVVRPNTAGASSLVAMKVPEARLEEVAEMVSAEPAVNHNYARDHAYNLWFVVTAEDAAAVAATIARIEAKTGLRALRLPLEKAYHIDLGFALWSTSMT